MRKEERPSSVNDCGENNEHTHKEDIRLSERASSAEGRRNTPMSRRMNHMTLFHGTMRAQLRAWHGTGKPRVLEHAPHSYGHGPLTLTQCYTLVCLASVSTVRLLPPNSRLAYFPRARLRTSSVCPSVTSSCLDGSASCANPGCPK